MQKNIPMSLRFSVLVAGLSLTTLFGVSSAALAQNTVNAPVLVQGDTNSAPATRAQRQRTVSDVTTAMTRGASTSGIYVVADSTTGALSAPLPAEATTPENVEKQVTALVAALPPGSLWVKLYLPAPTNPRRGYNGDDVAAYALAQSKLVGTVGAATPPGVVEILGQKVPQDKAEQYIAGLNLKPVYLITNPRATAPSGFGLTMDAGKWAAMSPEQRQDYARQQASALGQMDPAARNQMLQQNMMIFTQFMQNATPEQRQSLIQGMMQNGGNVIIRTAPGGPPPAP